MKIQIWWDAGDKNILKHIIVDVEIGLRYIRLDNLNSHQRILYLDDHPFEIVVEHVSQMKAWRLVVGPNSSVE